MKILFPEDCTEEMAKGRMNDFEIWLYRNDPEFEIAKEFDFFTRVEREV